MLKAYTKEPKVQLGDIDILYSGIILRGFWSLH